MFIWSKKSAKIISAYFKSSISVPLEVDRSHHIIMVVISNDLTAAMRYLEATV